MRMRTIKFRGFNKKRGCWLFGNYIQNRVGHFVAPNEFANGKIWDDYEIDIESLGQYTGCTDKNDSPIFEGDIIYFTVFDCFDRDTQYKGVVEWVGTRFVLSPIIESEFEDGFSCFDLDHVEIQDCELEIVGNNYEEQQKGREQRK